MRLFTLPFLLLPFLAACNGGGRSTTAETNLGFLPIRCNLGCDPGDPESRGTLPPNWSIEVEFNEPLAESTLLPAALTVLDEQGTPVAGRLEAVANRARFHPRIEVAGGKVVYPWQGGRECSVVLAADELAARSGRRLARTYTLRFHVQVDPVDQDGLLPSVKLLNPPQVEPAAPDTMVVLEFSEYVRPAALRDRQRLYLAASLPGGGSWQKLPLSPQVVNDLDKRTTQAIFESTWLFPAQARMKVFYEGIQDLAGQIMPEGELYFSIRAGGPVSGHVTEEFLDDSMCDKEAGSLDWAGGGERGLRPGRLGGGGWLGEFVAPPGETVISTEEALWPASQTLTGRPIRVTNGVFFFQRFVVPLESIVHFRGSYPLRLHVAGDLLVAGRLLLEGMDAPPHDGGPDQPRGGLGGEGGPGGGAGGRGGGQEIFSQVTGFDGSGLVLLPGHPRAAAAGACAGRGAPGHPATGKATEVIYDGQEITRMVAAGGGGGGYMAAGGPGQVTRAPAPVQANRGGDSPLSSPFPMLPLSSTLDSLTQFLLGGAGGGGGGAHPWGSKKNFFNFVQWRAAGGGGGGGGAMGARLGGRLLVAAGALISAQGGEGSRKNTSLAAPGGGGSGGSLLFQCGDTAILGGTISVLGGAGGRTLDLQKGIELVGGAGSPGFCRFETPQTLPLSALATLWPPPVPENVGSLQYRGEVTSGRSRIYETDRLLPQYDAYELVVRQGTQDVTYSDDPARGVEPVPGVSPVSIRFQGIHLDEGKHPVRYFPWAASPTTMTPAGESPPQGFRFTLCLDRSRLSPSALLEVRKLQVFFR